MYQTKSYEIKSCDDIELSIKRESLLEFKVSFDDEKEMKALFFFIPGLGEDNNEEYQEKIAEFVVKEYSVAVVRVSYHAIGNRPQTGSKFYLDDIDKMILQAAYESVASAGGGAFKIPEELLNADLKDTENLNALFKFISTKLGKLKNQGYLSPNFLLKLSISIQPSRGEYQNFGLMQALDCLNALFYIQKNPPFKLSKNYPVIMMGSSHGGYIAHLAAKFAPWAVDSVLDNSSYANIVARLTGIGKEIDYTTLASCGSMGFFTHIHVLMFDKTFWTTNKSSPNYFSSARKEIRCMSLRHLDTLASSFKPKFISYHCLQDILAPLNEKQAVYERLKALNLDATLHSITKQSQVDGKFIKELSHGMGMSLKTLIKKHLPSLLEYKKPKSQVREVTYLCGKDGEELIYHFSQVEDKMKLEITKPIKPKE